LLLAFVLGAATTASAQSLVASVLPISRSVQVGTAATAFATVINAGSATATGCRISLPAGIPANFSFQTTNPTTNQVTGTRDTAVNIPAGGTQTFVFSITPLAPIDPTDVALVFSCTNAGSVQSISGLNTLLLSVSSTPIPDIVALAATLANDGIASAQGVSGAGVLSVATVNVGASGTIIVTADTGNSTLPVSIAICQTNPTTGACLTPAGSSVTTVINANATPTFGIFLTGFGQIAFQPATNRAFIRFRDSGNVVRGATSVALRTVTEVGGVFVGSGSETQTRCINPGDNVSFSGPISLNLGGQVGESFSGSGTTTFAVPGGGTMTTSVSLSGTLNVSEQLRGSFSFTEFFSGVPEASGTGAFTATLSGRTLSVTFSGQDTAGDTCVFNGSATLTRQ